MGCWRGKVLILTDACCRIHQYFDGKCSDDEILYRAEITRKQLREVLHHYEEYVRSIAVVLTSLLTVRQLQTFLHPS